MGRWNRWAVQVPKEPDRHRPNPIHPSKKDAEGQVIDPGAPDPIQKP